MNSKNDISMRNIFFCLSGEIVKLKRQKFFYITLIFIILFTLFAAFFREKLASGSLLSMGFASGWQIATFAASWTMKIVALVILIFSAQLIADEFTDRTIKTMLTAPVTRSEFLMGKFLTILFVTTIFVMLVFLTSLIAGASMGRLSEFQERGYVIVSQQKIIFSFTIAFLLSAFTMTAVGIFGAAVAVILPRAALAIGVALALYFIFNILGQFQAIRKFLFTSYTFFPIDTAKEIAHGLSSAWTPKLFWCLGIDAMTIVTIWGGANFLFRRKDILT